MYARKIESFCALSLLISYVIIPPKPKVAPWPVALWPDVSHGDTGGGTVTHSYYNCNLSISQGSEVRIFADPD